MAALVESRGCPCTDDKEYFESSHFRNYGLPMLRTLHCVKHIINEEECKSVGKAGLWWDDELAVVIVVKGAVQETLGALEEYKRAGWYGITARGIKMLSELYQEKLVTEDEVKRMKGEAGYLSNRVVLVQCTKPPEVVARTTNVLDKYGHNDQARWLRALNELLTRHLLTAEECSEVARKGSWEYHLTPVLLTKPAEVVQEACQVLEKHGCRVEKELKMLSELYQEKLVTEDEVKRMQGGLLSDRVVLVQCTKPPEVIARTTNVLDKYRHNEKARWLRVLSELYQEKLVTEDEVKKMKGEIAFLSVRVVRVQCTKPPEVVARTVNVLDKYGHNEKARQLGEIMAHRRVAGMHLGLRGDSGYRGLSTASSDLGYGGSSTVSSDLGYGGSSIASSDLGYGGSSTVSSDLGYGGSSTAATSTHSSSHLVEHYQKMSMHPHAEGPSLSQTELSSEDVEEESKHQGSKVPSGPAGEGSDPPREPDSAAVKGAEAALVDLCWIPFGIQSQSVGPEGGKLSLEPSAGAIGGEEGGTILLEVPPGAVSPAESVEVRSALIPDGPFTLPEGYQLGSMVVYLCYDGRRLTKPCTLSLPHWYGGEDQVRDGLSFAMAPHTLKEGERVYRFELLEGGRFAEQQQCGVLEISGHCTLFAAVFKVKASSLYYASLWTHQVGGAVIADNEMHSKVVITYADLVWIEVLKKYWKDWKRHLTDPPVRFKFSGKKVRGMLSEQRGEGWEASLKGTGKVRSKLVAYHGIYSHKALESAVKEHVYPPAIHCVVMYESPPDCSRGVKMNKLSIKGTKTGERIDFPFKVYEVKTPHPPSSPSASASSSMGGCPSLPSPVDTDDEATQFSASEFLKKYETVFFEVVDPRLSLLRLVRKGVITEDVKSDITTSNTKDAREVLYHHLAHHANLKTLKEYCEVAVDAEGYPKMRSLGRKMMEELEHEGEQTH